MTDDTTIQRLHQSVASWKRITLKYHQVVTRQETDRQRYRKVLEKALTCSDAEVREMAVTALKGDTHE